MASQLGGGNPVACTIPAERRGEILRELAALASNAANAQIDSLTTRLSEALLRASAACIDPAEARLRFNAAALLKKNRYPFYYVVSERLGAVLAQEIRMAANPELPPEDGSEAPPTLDPDVEIDKRLSLVKASRAIENEHADRLHALGMRLGCLLGRTPLITAENPFRPHLFLAVVHDAWCEFQPDTRSHHAVFPLLGPELCFDMGPVLHAVNSALVKLGVMPQLMQVSRDANGVATAAAVEEPDNDELLPRLRRLFPDREGKPADRPLTGGFPSLFDDDAVVASVARNALLGYLTGFDKHRAGPPPAGLLDEIRRSAPRDALSETDDHVLRLLARIFEVVQADPRIAPELQKSLLELQLPALKAALSDQAFFFKRNHPPRRAVELLVGLCGGWETQRGLSDPLYLLIERSIARIAQEGDRRPAVFAEVVADLEAYRQREQTAAAQTLAAPIAGALQREKMLEAERAARHEVALRIGTGEVVAFVEAFLQDRWVPVLTLAYSVKDEKPQALDNALKTMDDLVWSVKPKITPEERKKLLSRLPSIVASLNKWLDVIRWNDEARAKFFSDLAKCHASIVRAPVELSPERQVQMALAVAKHAAERRLRKEAGAAPEPAPDEFDTLVAGLEQGNWVDFGREDRTRRLRLGWVSPLRNLYVFATHERREALSLTAQELAKAIREGRAHVAPGAGLIGKALAQALGVDRGGADAANAGSGPSDKSAA
jgi:hypothetical protein